ncbi:MAG TPA: hypothetical protein VFQ74_06075 [Pseudolysinimonas sp.]|nr:hypothetical protein [Pseudolysinimonas sp.]
MFTKIVALVATLLVVPFLSLVGVASSAAASGSGSRGLNTLHATGIAWPTGSAFTDNWGWIVLTMILLQIGVGFLAVRAVLTARRMADHRAG